MKFTRRSPKLTYHYTSFDNWQKIQAEGLVPYLMPQRSIVNLNLGPVHGIWTWPTLPDDLSHLGSILFQIGSKGTTHVVMLEITYYNGDVWTNKWGDTLCIRHTGSFGASREDFKYPGLDYHIREQSLILGRSIPPERIRKIGDWNLLENFNYTGAEEHEGIDHQ